MQNARQQPCWHARSSCQCSRNSRRAAAQWRSSVASARRSRSREERARKAAFSEQVRSLREPTFSKQNSHPDDLAGKNFACGARGLRRSLRATARSGQNRPPWPSPSSPSVLRWSRYPGRLGIAHRDSVYAKKSRPACGALARYGRTRGLCVSHKVWHISREQFST